MLFKTFKQVLNFTLASMLVLVSTGTIASTWVPIGVGDIQIIIPNPSLDSITAETTQYSKNATFTLNGVGDSTAIYYQYKPASGNASSWYCKTAAEITNNTISIDNLAYGAYTVSASATMIDEACDIAAFQAGSLISSEVITSTAFNLVNRAPVANADTATTNEDTQVTIDVLANDIDADGHSFSIKPNSYTATQGSVSLVTDANGQKLQFIPNQDFHGIATINYQIVDAYSAISGNDGKVTVTVDSVNDKPVAVNDVFSIVEDSQAIAINSVIANDSDVDGDNLTITSITGASKGSVNYSAHTGQYKYTPTANENGVDSLSYLISDGHGETALGSISISIASVNDTPVANAQSITTQEDTAIAVTLSGSDVENSALSYTIVSGPVHGQLTGNGNAQSYLPNGNYNGGDSFTFKVNDGTIDSTIATVSINVTQQNDTPVANAQSISTQEDTAIAISLSGSDVENSALIYTIVNGPTHGQLTGSGNTQTYQPSKDYNGTDSFTFKVNDGTVDSAVAIVSINVTQQNDTPVANAQSIATQEDTAIAITLSGSDVESSTLTYTIVNGPVHGQLTGNGNAQSYLPNGNYNGEDSFTFKVNDGTVDSAVAIVSINVTQQNDTPVANAQSIATQEDTAIAITLSGSDVESSTLTYTIVNGPVHGQLTGNGNAQSYLPNGNYNGEDSFTFKVNDGTIDSAIATVSINVTQVNDAPVATDGAWITLKNTEIELNLNNLVSDVDNNEVLTISLIAPASVSNGSLSLTSPGVYSYQPNNNYTGTDSFQYQVNDDDNAFSAVKIVSITVTASNTPPTGTVTINGETIVGNTLTATNTIQDVDGLGTFTYQWQANGTTIGANSSSYTLTTSEIGKTITVTISYTDDGGVLESVTSNPTANVTDIPTVPAPSLLPNGGNIAPTQPITLNGTGTIKYFITDNTVNCTAGASWINYSAPFNLTESKTVCAKTTVNGVESEITNRAFTVTVANNDYAETSEAPVPDAAFEDTTEPTPDNIVGTMAGSASVNGGAAGYNIPITLPPGRNGVQPSVSLNYSSRSGNGIAGVGWSLSAGSAISRCGATYAQDGFIKNVTYSALDDRLCLDGQRLVVTNGKVYGAADAVYGTEIESFVRVTPTNGINSATSSFEVEYKDGTTAFFGLTENSVTSHKDVSEIFTWHITMQHDASGKNYIHYNYLKAGLGETLIDNIRYTGEASNSQGDRKVSFSYIDRATKVSYLAGGLAKQTKVLNKIETFYGATSVRSYNLNLVPSETSGRFLLKSVTECGTDSKCLPATQFNWHQKEATFNLEPLGVDGKMSFPEVTKLDHILPRGDINGDGVRDWPGLYVDAEGRFTQRHENELNPCYYNNYTQSYMCVEGDFNRDGLTDDWYKDANNTLVLEYTGGNAVNTNIPLSDSSLGRLLDSYVKNISDYNGDGWPDLLIYHALGEDPELKLYLHSQIKSNPYTTGKTVYTYPVKETDYDGALIKDVQVMGDLTGDGSADLLIVDPGIDNNNGVPHAQPLPVTLLKNDGEGNFTSQALDLVSSTEPTEPDFSYFIDINGDGLQDWLGWRKRKVFVRFNMGYNNDTAASAVEGDVVFAPEISLNDNFIETKDDVVNLKGDGPLTRRVPKYAAAFKIHDINNDGVAELLMPGTRIYEGCKKIGSYGKGGFSMTHSETKWCGDELYGTYYPSNSEQSERSVDSAGEDHSIYQFKAVYFTVNTDEQGNASIDTAVKATNLYGHAYQSVIVDAFGNGLPGMVFNHTQPGSTTFNELVSDSPFAGNIGVEGVYINRNFGSGSGATNADYQPGDMLLSSTNGVGLTSEFTYRPLSTGADSETIKGKMYTKDALSPDDGQGYLYFASSMYVVHKFEQDNGVSGQNETEYAYENAMYNTQGRGFMGFKTLIEKDVTQQTVTQSEFKQLFPLQGKLLFQGTYTETDYANVAGSIEDDTSTALSFVKNEWTQNAANSQHYYLSRGVNITRAVNNSNTVGIQLSKTIKTITGIDEYGNVTERNTEMQGTDWGTSKTSVVNTFDTSAENITDWWLNKLTDTQKTSQSITARNQYDAYKLSGLSGLDTATTVYTHMEYNDTVRKPNLIRIATTAADGETNASQAPCATTDKLCSETTTVYNTAGLPTSISKTAAVMNKDGNWVQQTRNVSRITYSKDGVKQDTKDEGYFPYQITNAKDHKVITQTYPGLGKPKQVSKQLSASNYLNTAFSYDNFGRTYSVKTDGMPTQYMQITAPDTDEPTLAVMQVTTTQSGAPTQKTYTDKLGRSLRSAVAGFEKDQWIFQDKTFDHKGNLTFESIPKDSSGSQYGMTYSGFDVLGRPTTKVTSQACGADMTATYTYDGFKTEVDVVDGCTGGKTLNMRRTYNSLKQLVRTLDANKTNENLQGGITRYAYNNLGLPIVITDTGGNNIVATYNALGQKTQVIDPNQGTTNFVYNGFGELQQETRVGSSTITYVTDELGRVTERNATGATGEEISSYVYDTATNGLGQLKEESGNKVTRAYTYDNLGRPELTTINNDKETDDKLNKFEIETLYDSNFGRPKGLRYPNNLTLEYIYDENGYQTQVKNAANDYVYQEITARDHFGNVTEALLGGVVNHTASYNLRNSQVEQLQYVKGNEDLLNLEYQEYDGFGNLTKMKVTAGFLDTQRNFTESYQYDDLHRLKSLAVGNFTTITYDYDAMGNLLKKSDYSDNYDYSNGATGGPNAVKRVFKTKGKNKDTWVNFGYDSRGNMTSGDGLASAIYNAMDKPTSINKDETSLTFVYGPNHMRTKQTRKTDGKTIETYYADKLYEVEVEKEGNINKYTSRAYIGGIAIIKDISVGNTLQSQDISYSLKDRLGSARLFVDETGTAKGELRNFDPFGKPRLAAGGDQYDGDAKLTDTDISRRGFTDHEQLDEVELIHMNGRVYDYNLGRFMSVDPFIQSPGNSQSFNPYSYIMNNPLAGTDPTGYSAEGLLEQEKPVTVTGSRIKRRQSLTKNTAGSITVGGSKVSTSFGVSSIGAAAANYGNASIVASGPIDIGSQASIASEKNSEHISLGGEVPDNIDNESSKTATIDESINEADKVLAEKALAQLAQMSALRKGKGPDAHSFSETGTDPYSGEENSLIIEVLSKIVDDPNTFDWIAHGTIGLVFDKEVGYIDIQGSSKRANGYAVTLFLEKQGWKPGMNIRLIACYTGALGNRSFAQLLANELRVNVTGPTYLIQINKETGAISHKGKGKDVTYYPQKLDD